MQFFLFQHLIAQYEDWNIYNSGKTVQTTAIEGAILWIVTFGGTAMIDGDSRTKLPSNTSGNPSDDLCSIESDDINNIWFGSSHVGLINLMIIPIQYFAFIICFLVYIKSF